MLLTMQEYQLLLQIRRRPLPVARFELHSSADPGLVSTALNHVYMTSPEDSMERVRETARPPVPAEGIGAYRADLPALRHRSGGLCRL